MSTSQTQPTDPRAIDDRDQRADAVREMFAAIAPRYDFLNHLLSLNIDRRWRKQAVDLLDWERSPMGLYLDACAGTLDLAIELAERPGFAGHVLAADFAAAMLEEGQAKIGDLPITAVCADALRLPVTGSVFDGAMVAFGVRNLTDIDVGVRELRRVLRAGARLVILDFATPARQPLRGLYLFYFTRLLPLIGRLVSKHSYAYRYLPDSVLAFPGPSELGDRLEQNGFIEVNWRSLSAGIACVWWATRP